MCLRLILLHLVPLHNISSRHQLIAELDPHNAGVLIIHLDGQGRGMDPDEVTRRLDKSNEDCVIM